MSLLCRHTAFKLTGWLTLLLVLLHVQVFALPPRLEVDHDTKEYINGLYANPFIPNLINEYPQEYLRVVFRHFRADFVQNDIGNWDNSHWPILLQDLNLMPGRYRTRNAAEDAEPLRDFWLQEKDSLEAQPIANYQHRAIRVPDFMMIAFSSDEPALERQSRSIPYKYLVDKMQQFVEQYNVRDRSRKQTFMRSRGKRARFLAMYWLTVLDQFIGEVQRVAGAGAILASPSPRTHLMPLDPQQAPGQRAPPPAYPHNPGPRAPPPAYPHNPGPRAPPPAYPHNPGPRAPPPAYPHNPGPRAPPPAYPHNPGPRAPPPAYPQNAGLEPNLVAQHSPRVGHVAAPLAGPVIVHWNGQYASPQQAQGPRAPPPAYPHHVGPRVGPMAQPMAHPMAQPGPSGSNPGKRAPSPNRGTKRKATHQGGGPFQGGGKRGPGGSMRSMDGASNESQVGLQAQQSNSGGSSTALPFISAIMVTIAMSLISFV